MNAVCVYCGASPGRSAVFGETATALGERLARDSITLVYGGGSVGLMGRTADACLQHGGRVDGVITEHLAGLEVGHERLTRLHVVRTMHERKALMADLSDGFIALPGGFGTLDEFCEVLTWAQLGIHRKPCALLNVDGYYDAFLEFIGHMVETRFLLPEHRSLIVVDDEIDGLLDKMHHFQPVVVEKWVDRKISADLLP